LRLGTPPKLERGIEGPSKFIVPSARGLNEAARQSLGSAELVEVNRAGRPTRKPAAAHWRVRRRSVVRLVDGPVPENYQQVIPAGSSTGASWSKHPGLIGGLAAAPELVAGRSGGRWSSFESPNQTADDHRQVGRHRATRTKRARGRADRRRSGPIGLSNARYLVEILKPRRFAQGPVLRVFLGPALPGPAIRPPPTSARNRRANSMF